MPQYQLSPPPPMRPAEMISVTVPCGGGGGGGACGGGCDVAIAQRSLLLAVPVGAEAAALDALLPSLPHALAEVGSGATLWPASGPHPVFQPDAVSGPT